MNMETATYVSFKNQNQLINSEVEITSLAFQQSSGNKRGLQGYPRRMVWGGREYSFVELGMQYLVKKGQELVRLFDMSDELGATYRLRLENNCWTLVGMKENLL